MSIDWYKAAETDLREYTGLLDAIKSLEERVAMLSGVSLRGPVLDDVPIHGGGSHYEDHLINEIVEADEKKRLLAINRQRVKMIERGLQSLSDEERAILEGFYIYPMSTYRCADILAEKLSYDRATVHRRRGAAMRKYVLHTYGLPKT